MPVTGRVYSHTTIRVPGAPHAAGGPFALVLVDIDGGGRVLGRVQGASPPDIGTTVVADDANGVPIFRLTEE